MNRVLMLLAAGVLPLFAWAVLPDDAYTGLRESARTIISGMVVSIDETGKNENDTFYRATVEVTGVERGDVEVGETIYIDYSVPNEEMPGPGHLMIWPNAGFRLWLNGGDGVYAPAAYKASSSCLSSQK
jgi:hypothetical protein